MSGAFYPFLMVFQGPKGRKERDERRCLETKMRSYKKVEDRRSSMKEMHGDGPMVPLTEKGPE